MDINKLETHIRLCKRNLNRKNVKCCGNCPFEEEILTYYPELRYLFELKRRRTSEVE